MSVLLRSPARAGDLPRLTSVLQDQDQDQREDAEEETEKPEDDLVVALALGDRRARESEGEGQDENDEKNEDLDLTSIPGEGPRRQTYRRWETRNGPPTAQVASIKVLREMDKDAAKAEKQLEETAFDRLGLYDDEFSRKQRQRANKESAA